MKTAAPPRPTRLGALAGAPDLLAVPAPPPASRLLLVRRCGVEQRRGPPCQRRYVAPGNDRSMGRWIGMSDRQAAKYGCITSRPASGPSGWARGPGGCRWRAVARGGEDGHVEGPREVLQALERRVQQLVAARARRELGLRRRDGREDELPPRRARVQLAAGDQGRRADARARRRRREEESQQAALRHVGGSPLRWSALL